MLVFSIKLLLYCLFCVLCCSAVCIVGTCLFQSFDVVS